MVLLLEELHNIKDYKIETLYLAVSLADRYLVNFAVSRYQPPCHITLAVTCLLIAAKLEEDIVPSYKRMISALEDNSVEN